MCDRCDKLSWTCTLSAKNGQSSIEDEWMSYGFGTTWGWVINDRIFIFGLTIPLNLGCTHFCNPSFKQNWLIYLFYIYQWHIYLCFIKCMFISATLEGFWAWTDCLRSCHNILSHSEVNLLVCLGSLFCCITQVRLSLRSQTDGRTFSFRIFW